MPSCSRQLRTDPWFSSGEFSSLGTQNRPETVPRLPDIETVPKPSRNRPETVPNRRLFNPRPLPPPARAPARPRARARAGVRSRGRARMGWRTRASLKKQSANNQRTNNKQQTANNKRTKNKVSGRFRDGFGTVSGRFRDGFGTVSKSGSIGTVLGTLLVPKAEFSPEENQRSERYLREHLGIRSPALLAYPRVALPPCPRTLEYLCRSKPPYGSANFGGSPRTESISSG